VSWRTNRFVLGARNLARRIGLNRLIASLVAGKDYEERFQAAMLASIRQGDIVWDVGANIGLYSKKFAAITGSAGKVFAYEPSPANLQFLKVAVASLTNVTVLPVALGEHEGIVVLQQGDDLLGATSRIVNKRYGKAEKQIEVPLSTGDGLVSTGTVASPNVIKIDTEGFELDVLFGLRQTLQEKSLRAVCIEMHFALLQERGLQNAPSEIERLLGSSGFTIRWADASHIVASRTS
jgi:FkbM family methyltransferase